MLGVWDFFFERVEKKGKEAAGFFLMVYTGGIYLRGSCVYAVQHILLSHFPQQENVAVGT